MIRNIYEFQKAQELIKTLQTENETLQHKGFSSDDIKHDDHLVELYTGISSYSIFQFLSSKLEVKVAKMQYNYKGINSHKCKRYQINENQGRKPGKENQGRKEPCQ